MTTSRPPLHGWIGVDLDATLAHYGGWRGGQHIGAPIEPMIARVRAWIAEGREVRVFTARASDPEQIPPVRAWLDGLGLSAVGVTNVKDFAMVELWDDRCVQVKPNTGIAYGPSRIDGDVHVDTTVPDETIANLRAQVERLTDLVRHQRGDLHTANLITDAEYADLAGISGSPARLEGYDALRGELAITKRALNVAIRERDEARRIFEESTTAGIVLRLTDLVRHQRGPLHDAGLIADEEYALLAADHTSVARLEGYDEARAALAAARVDGARGMRDAAEGVVNARLTLCRNGIERLYDADGDCDRPEDLRAARGRENLYERVIGEIRALDPATVVGSAPPADRFPCTACPNFVPTNGAGNGWACRAIDDSADWIDRATGAVNGRMADGHEVPIPQDARTCSAFGKPATVGSRS